MISRLVGRVPDVSQGDSRVKPVEDAERKGHVLDDGPEVAAVELLLCRSVPVRFGLQRVPDVERLVGDEQKCHQIPA